MTPPLTDISVLPPLYAGWMDTLLGGAIPPETDATCGDCAMCPKSDGGGPAQTIFFNPVTQCCTYFPTLPNFLVGRILRDPDLGESPVHAMVNGARLRGEVVTPLGIRPPASHEVLYRNNLAAGFGRDPSLRCPFHLDPANGRGPGCGIWTHRQAMCTTWFCKYVRGQTGKAFWAELHKLLDEAERVVQWWCLLQAGIGDAALRFLAYLHESGLHRTPAIDRGRLDEELSAENYRLAWDRWLGKEAEFFAETARLANALVWDDLLRMGGPELRLHARFVRQSYDRLVSEGIPDRLELGQYRVTATGPSRSLILAYSPLDPLEVPNVLMNVLHHFDGRPTEDALAAIAAASGLTIAPRVLRKLVDFRILVPC